MNFDVIIEFCKTYWREILSCLTVLITVVIQLLKKRPSYNLLDAIKEDILGILPELICAVEIDGNGQRKKNAVIDAVKSFVEKKYGISLPDKLLIYVSNAIEDILSTPQKKGS